MNITEPLNSGNPTDNINCPRCGTSVPSFVIFCSACGEQITWEKNEKVGGGNENGRDVLLDLEAYDTVPLRAVSQPHLNGSRSYKPPGKNGRTGQFQQFRKNPLLPPNAEASAIADVADMEMIKYGTTWSLVIHKKDPVVIGTKAWTWGWLPVLSLTSAVGVFLLALAYNAGRSAAPWAELLYWIGIGVFFLPIAIRAISSKPTRGERIALLIVLAIALYFVKVLAYPLYFALYDEFSHTRTALDIAASGHLFQFNALLPISSLYPGMEIATNALSSLTGLSVFDSGLVLIGTTRLLFVLTLYLLYERFSNSERVAGLATLLYMANSGFVSADEMFSYESLALPLALFILFLVERRRYETADRRLGLFLVICLGLGALVATHHVTSYALVAFLLLWTAIWMIGFFRRGRNWRDEAGPLGVALLGLVLCIGWIFYTGGIVIDYLVEPLSGALHQLTQILLNQIAPRQLLNSGKFVAPLWERITSYSSEALIVLGLPFGLFKIWRNHRSNAPVLALAIGAIAFPAAQIFRFTQKGAEAADRSTEFLFLGVGFVLAIGAVEFWLSRAPSWRRKALIIGAVAVIFFGQMIIGTEPLERLPGPYLVSADQRSVEPEGIDAAEWALAYLGPGNRIATDRTNTLLMGTYGNQAVVTSSNETIATWPLFLSLEFQPQMVLILKQDKIQYLVVDHRLSTGIPIVGTYFNKGEPDAYQYTHPIDLSALEKFDSIINVSRVFDSGDIVIYDVQGLTDGSASTSIAPSPCNQASPAAVPSSPKLARTYTGSIYDMTTGQVTKISLSGIQQQGEKFCGDFTGLGRVRPFAGIIAPGGKIQFMVTTSAGQAILTFEGIIQPDGALGGSNCHSGAGRCSDYGIWSLATGT